MEPSGRAQSYNGRRRRAGGRFRLQSLGKLNGVVRFGKFEADLDTGRLLKNGRAVKLQDQPFRLLAILMEHAGEVVSRDELRQQIWADNTFVDFDQGLAAAINRVRKALGDRADRPRFVETVPRRGYRFLAAVEQVKAGPVEHAVGIAVLPFANISPHPEDEYLSDGLTEELIHALTRVQGLRVTSRTSAFAFKDNPSNVREVAKLLNVEILLEGSVRKDQDNLRVTAQLVNAAQDFHLWSRTYDRKLQHVFQIQEEIARAIEKAVRSEVEDELPGFTLKPVTENFEAYNLYLKGRHFWNMRSPDGLRRSVEFFQRSIAEDSGFAAAYAGLADAYVFLAVYGAASTGEMLAKADVAVRAALRIDENFAEAYASRGTICVAEYDLPGAYESFRRAVELNPGLANAHHFFAMASAAMGRLDVAISEILKALAGDPLAITANQDAGRIFYYARRYDEAVGHFRSALEIQPLFAFAHRYLGMALLQKGVFEEAITEFGSDQTMVAVTQALMGEKRSARDLLIDLQARPNRKHFREAMLHVALGHVKPAVASLELAFEQKPYDFAEQHDQLLVLGVDPFFDSLRSDPNFKRLVQRTRSGGRVDS